MNDMSSDARAPDRGSAGEVFVAFLKLGLTSFGGPVAHLAYFHDAFVTRRRWLSAEAYAELVALAQFLPGPASSKVGFALGLQRAGLAGALAAWVAFTLPTALLLIAFASSASLFEGTIGQGLMHGLKLVAVAIVAQAVYTMARSLCPDIPRALFALAAIAIVFVIGGAAGQVAAILVGALAGRLFCRPDPASPSDGDAAFAVSRRAGAIALGVFALLLIGLPILAALTGSASQAVFDAFYRAGALVFGGGHVVLPLLEESVVAPGWVTQDAFLAGYGATQAAPGPIFGFAAYLGWMMAPEPNGAAGAMLGLAAIFLPGLLLMYGALPFWGQIRFANWARAAVMGANAAVVGILAAALYDPVFTSAVLSVTDLLIALAGFALLVFARLAPFVVVAIVASAAVLMAAMS